MRLPTFWAICEVGLHGIAVGVESILQGFVAMCFSSGAMSSWGYHWYHHIFFFQTYVRRLHYGWWLGTWNFMTFHHMWDVILPVDFHSYFSR